MMTNQRPQRAMLQLQRMYDSKKSTNVSQSCVDHREEDKCIGVILYLQQLWVYLKDTLQIFEPCAYRYWA